MSATRPPSFDERYAAPVEASRRGAHRARPNPVTGLLPIVAGVVVIVVVVAGAYMLLGGNNTPSSSPSSSVAAAPTQSQPAPSASASQPAPSASESASAEPSAGESEGAAGDVDKTIELRVRNSTSVSGLAKKVADALEEDDWTIGEVGDANQRGLEVTRVYYADDDAEATAEAIVESLGYGETRKSASNAGDGITVVVGDDADSAN